MHLTLVMLHLALTHPPQAAPHHHMPRALYSQLQLSMQSTKYTANTVDQGKFRVVMFIEICSATSPMQGKTT
jgi:hypothetical protein